MSLKSEIQKLTNSFLVDPSDEALEKGQVLLPSVALVELTPDEQKILKLSDNFKRVIVSQTSKDLSSTELTNIYLSPTKTITGCFFIYVDINNIIDIRAISGFNPNGYQLCNLVFNSGAEINRLKHINLVPSLSPKSIDDINSTSLGELPLCSQNTPYIKNINLIRG